jgi:hypothetical protein
VLAVLEEPIRGNGRARLARLYRDGDVDIQFLEQHLDPGDLKYVTGVTGLHRAKGVGLSKS